MDGASFGNKKLVLSKSKHSCDSQSEGLELSDSTSGLGFAAIFSEIGQGFTFCAEAEAEARPEAGGCGSFTRNLRPTPTDQKARQTLTPRISGKGSRDHFQIKLRGEGQSPVRR